MEKDIIHTSGSTYGTIIKYDFNFRNKGLYDSFLISGMESGPIGDHLKSSSC